MLKKRRMVFVCPIMNYTELPIFLEVVLEMPEGRFLVDPMLNVHSQPRTKDYLSAAKPELACFMVQFQADSGSFVSSRKVESHYIFRSFHVGNLFLIQISIFTRTQTYFFFEYFTEMLWIVKT